MKKIAIAAAAVAILVSGLEANARLAFGVKAGLNVDKFSTNKDKFFDGSNRAGFTVGVMGEYTLPMIGLGFDLSLMYTRMNSDMEIESGTTTAGSSINSAYNIGHNFLEIPLNVKYKFSIPVVQRIFAPYVYTGPTLALKLDGNGDGNSFKTHTCQWGWNVGVGLEFIRHLQIGAGYTFGMNNIMKSVDVNVPILGTMNTENLKVKNNYWTVTAAWLF